jgi:hypothetical protein
MKYSGISIEEYRKIRNAKRNEWIENKGDEYKQKLKEDYKKWMLEHGEEKKDLYKQAKGGVCHCCGDKYYTNLYQHKKSKKHIKNVGIEKNSLSGKPKTEEV